MLWSSGELEELWKNTDPFIKAFNIHGTVYRELEARKTTCFEFNNKSYFIKAHQGIGWKAIFENLIRLRKPVLGAKDEWKAIDRLNCLGIKTMTVIAYGERGKNPAQRQSFIITENLINTISLEDLCSDWNNSPPAFFVKYILIKEIANISNTLHNNGVNHRDYYLCHFLIKKDSIDNIVNSKSAILFLIDLHRCQIRSKTPARWIIKDIAGLWFSALHSGLTKKDLFRFLIFYTKKPLRQALIEYNSFLKIAKRRVASMQNRSKRRQAETNLIHS